MIFSKAESFKCELSDKYIREVGHCVVLQCTSKRSLVFDVSKTVAKNSYLSNCRVKCYAS